MRGLPYKTVHQAYVTSERANARFHLIHVPDDVPDIANALSFGPAEMQRMFAGGVSAGSDPSAWLKEPPRLEPLERTFAR